MRRVHSVATATGYVVLGITGLSLSGVILRKLWGAVAGRSVPAVDAASGGRRRVLVTGCDTGFGHATALALHAVGYVVYAGCITDAAMEEFAKIGSDRLRPVRLDVTNDDHVQQVAALLAKEGDQLWAVVNNAGIAAGYLVDWTPLTTFKKVMDVNMFGHVRVIQACLPMLIKARGRIINMASVSGFIPCAGMSAYCASKYAVEGFTDCLRLEMHDWGVQVAIIEPGVFDTPLVAGGPNMVKSAYDALPADVKARYGAAYAANSVAIASQVRGAASNPTQVVDTLVHCVGVRKLKARYRVGLDAHLLWLPLFYMPPTWKDRFLLAARRSTTPAALQ